MVTISKQVKTVEITGPTNTVSVICADTYFICGGKKISQKICADPGKTYLEFPQSPFLYEVIAKKKI